MTTNCRGIGVWLEPFALADRLVTNGEFAEFIADGGYRRRSCGSQPDGMRWSRTAGARRSTGTKTEENWKLFTLRGEMPLEQS